MGNTNAVHVEVMSEFRDAPGLCVVFRTRDLLVWWVETITRVSVSVQH